ncbi:MAG: hypothetical protein GC192_10245 [Bacteroidetes bacterium]|nr:hypothetical protein [Bacteroidota bacterium]
MKINHLFTFILLFAFICCNAQKKVFDIGIEAQIYPTGYIPGFYAEKSFSQRDLGTVRFGYQIIDHRDQGKHDSEKGSGYGGTLGYKHYFKKYFVGPSLSLRTDFWANKLDWTTNLEAGGEIKGKTDILVLQPTLEFGWAFAIGDNFALTPTVAYGFEKNIKTKGEPTGEGAIMLAGLKAAYRIW